MVRNYTQTKRGRTISEILFGVGSGVLGPEKTGSILGQWQASDQKMKNDDWKKVGPEDCCKTLHELGAPVVPFHPTTDKCSKYVGIASNSHHLHQFQFDVTQVQCCQCELVIPQLDYVELQEEGLV